MIQYLVWVVDAAILATYFLLASGRWTARPFHWANAIGAPFLIVTEIAVGAWGVLPLTAAFGIIGLVGLLKGDK